MVQILNFIMIKQPPSWPEFLEDCPDGGTIPDCEIHVEPDYWGAPPPTETYGDLEVVNCPMESLTAKCGASVSVWMKPGCPPDTPDVVCDDVQNPTDIDPGSSEIIYILDGEPPYLWEIESGYGYTLESETTGDLGGRPDERKNSQNILYAAADSCGTAKIKITDNCLTELICGIPGSGISDFEYDWTASGQTIGQSDSTSVAVSGGKAPYSWAITGGGFTLTYSETGGVTNTVHTTASACGSGVITITDVCGDEIGGSIRCTSGQWIEVARGLLSCTIKGQGVCNGFTVELFQGRYKMHEIVAAVCSNSGWGACPPSDCAGADNIFYTEFDPYMCLYPDYWGTPINCCIFSAPGSCGLAINCGTAECCTSGTGLVGRLGVIERILWDWQC